jgi:glycosyltransferase involved in cell wall biosynthesis
MLLDTDIKNSTELFCLSNNVKQQILQKSYYKNKQVSVFPIGPFFQCNPENYHSKVYNNTYNFLFFGRISKYKGLDLLIESWVYIKNEIPNARLFIYGSGELNDAMISKISLDQTILLENRWIDENEIINIFKKSNICLLPYIEASQSGVISISISQGVPVVVTPELGLIEQVKQFGCGVISSSFEPKDFAASCIRLATNQPLYNKLCEEAISNSIKNSWDNISLNMLNKIILT